MCESTNKAGIQNVELSSS